MAIYRLLLFRWAPLVYLVTALPTAIFLAYLAPPFQAPEESGHFMRAVQVLGGFFVAAPDASGGVLPANAVSVANAFHAMDRKPDVKLDPALIASQRILPWAPESVAAASFPEAVATPPFLYEPAAIGLGAARLFGLGVYDSYWAARLVYAVVTVGLGTLALSLALGGRALLFVLLSLPTTLYLAAAVTPDGLLVACVALTVALCSRAFGTGRPLGAWRRVLMALLLGVVVATRVAYWPMLLLLLTAAARPRRPRAAPINLLVALTPLALAVAIALGWSWLAGRAPVLPAMPTPASLKAGVDALGEQVTVLPGVLWHTLMDLGPATLKAAVGVLGMGDTPIPFVFIVAWLVALALSLGLALVEEGEAFASGTALAVLVAAAVATCLVVRGVPAPQSPEAAAGLIGRGLLPILSLLALVPPGIAPARRRMAYSTIGTVFAVVGWTAIFALAAVSDWLMLPPVLLARFYL